MMNILHISRTMGQGGAEKVVYQICESCNDNNKMFVASIGGSYENDLKQIKVNHFHIPDLNSKNPIVIIKTLFILNRIITKNKIDIIHSHHRMAAFYSKILCTFHKKIKRVYTAHNVFYDKRFLTKYSIDGSKIIAVGKGVKDNLVNFFSISDGLVEIIYNSVEKPEEVLEPEDELFKNKGKKTYVAAIGRLNKQKGFDVFINSLSNVIKKDSNVYGIIVGDGELKSELVEKCKELEIENNITFLGFRKDIFSIIKSIDFVVLPSRWEGFPLTPIETFSMGKTIIVSDIAGNNEIVNKSNGILFEKDNITKLEKSISELIYNTELRSKLEDNALKTYNEKFSYDKFVKNYFNVYNNIE